MLNRLRVACHGHHGSWLRLTVSKATYATQVPKKAAGVFTSNKHIAQPVQGETPAINKTLVYIGPFAETIRRYKMTASLFGICGLCAVPALMSTGQAPPLSVIKDKWLGIETCNFFGKYSEENMWLSELRTVPSEKSVLWKDTKRRKATFALEKAVMESDPFLRGLADRCRKMIS
ncbi:uncharacterized protein BYT42DRAFT_488249 [Radiomyces spectabilis]|uniref:uncharacterized protein n=1 Tax=Radiomyces spectabilis TaxID=64574 RepID=UPI00221E9983|nr:uncharacterized protein BYT42DRAFT_488249 [Radiomyces spectabilis]KAI8393365.1 hypothetical protein BYT42DRAFT_488249 [Radiomyces spectabilis]